MHRKLDYTFKEGKKTKFLVSMEDLVDDTCDDHLCPTKECHRKEQRRRREEARRNNPTRRR